MMDRLKAFGKNAAVVTAIVTGMLIVWEGKFADVFLFML